MKNDNNVSGMRASNPQSGPLTDGGYRVVKGSWGFDYNRNGIATGACLWPRHLDDVPYHVWRKAAMAAASRLRPIAD